MKKGACIISSLLLAVPVIFPFVSEAADSPEKPASAMFHQEITWSPDGKRISFTANRDQNWDVFVMKADGSQITRLTEDPAQDRYTTWSPDGKKIAFSSNREGKQDDIYVMNADGSGVTRLTRDPGRDTTPAWSPDGKKIAFVSNREGSSQIYVMAPDGSNPVRLTKLEGNLYNPMWSPDGSRIVFYMDRGDKKDQIYVIQADGSNPALVTGGVAHNVFPSWLPNSRTILFSSDRNGAANGPDYGLYTIGIAGADLAQLTGLKGFFARWSPDGSRIAFISGGYPATEVHVVPADRFAVHR